MILIETTGLSRKYALVLTNGKDESMEVNKVLKGLEQANEYAQGKEVGARTHTYFVNNSKKKETVKMQEDLPNVTLQSVITYRTSYYLNNLSRDNKKLIPTHVVVCLAAGRKPTWGIFDFDTGRLIGTTINRASIENHRWYKNKVWRKRQVSMKLGKVSGITPYEERMRALEDQVNNIKNNKKKHNHEETIRV